MLWFILIFFVLMAIPAVLISARNQGVMMDALAMHENLKRNHPDDPLAQLGPHEFQRIFHRAQINRGKPTINRGFLWFFFGILTSIPIAIITSYFESEALVVTVILLTPLGFGLYGGMAAHSKRPELFDQMRAELKL